MADHHMAVLAGAPVVTQGTPNGVFSSLTSFGILKSPDAVAESSGGERTEHRLHHSEVSFASVFHGLAVHPGAERFGNLDTNFRHTRSRVMCVGEPRRSSWNLPENQVRTGHPRWREMDSQPSVPREDEQEKARCPLTPADSKAPHHDRPAARKRIRTPR